MIGAPPADAGPRDAVRAPTLVQLGFACNNCCVFCAQGTLRSHATRTESAAVRVALQQVASDDHGIVTFVGGEPTLDPNLADYIREARGLGCSRVLVQTNGRRLAYPAYLRALCDAGLSAVEISLAGPRADVHDYHTRVAGSFRQSLAGLHAARRARIPVGLTFVVTRSNYRHLAECVAMTGHLGVQAVHLASARPRGTALAELARVVPRFEALADQLARTAEALETLGVPTLVSGVPLCLAQGLQRRTLEQLQQQPPAANARLGPDCEPCALRAACPGVEPSYAERYGFGELAPQTAWQEDADAPSVLVAARAAWLFAGLGHAEPQRPWSNRDHAEGTTAAHLR